MAPARLIPPGWRCVRGSAFCRAASSHAPRSDGWMDVHCSRSRDGMGARSWERGYLPSPAPGCPAGVPGACPGDAGASPIAPRPRKRLTHPGPGTPAGILPCARPAEKESSAAHHYPKVTRPCHGSRGSKHTSKLSTLLTPGWAELSQQRRLNRGSFIGPVQGEVPIVTPGTSLSPGHTSPARPPEGTAAWGQHGRGHSAGVLAPHNTTGGFL